MTRLLFAVGLGLSLLFDLSVTSYAQNSCPRECHRTCAHAQDKGGCMAACSRNCMRR